METCVILSARPYSFTDEATSRNVSGVTVTYLSGDVENSPTLRGAFPMTIPAPPEIFATLGPLPGLYDVDFKQRPGKGGRPTLHIVAVKFRQAVNLFGAAAE